MFGNKYTLIIANIILYKNDFDSKRRQKLSYYVFTCYMVGEKKNFKN